MRRILAICSSIMLLLVSLASFSSCQKEDYDNEAAGKEDGYRGDNLPSLSSQDKILPAVYLSPALEQSFSNALKGRTSQTLTSDEASVLALTMDEYNSLKTSLEEDGRIAIVYHPDKTLLDSLGMDVSSTEKPEEIVTEEETEDDATVEEYDEDEKAVAAGRDVLCVVFCPRQPGNHTVWNPTDGQDMADCLEGLVSWVNSTTANTSANSSDQPFDDVYGYGFRFTGELEKPITNVVGSKHDVLKGNYAISAHIDVTPLHGFKSSLGEGMDYYLISSTTTVESAPMYSGNFSSNHGAVVAHICGFYFRGLHSNISIRDKAGNTVGYFIQVPTPATVTGSTDYTTGWNFSCGGDLTGGVLPSATLRTGFNFSSSNSRTISDCDMVNYHKEAEVIYNFNINNLPRYSGGIKNPPPIAVNTAKFYSQWVWAVPTKDYDSSTKYQVKVSLSSIKYGASYYYTTNADYHNLIYTLPYHTEYYTLPMPNRHPTGSFELTNIKEGTVITKVTLKNKTYSSLPEYVDKNQYYYGKSGSMYLPEGKYELTCDVYHPSTKVTETYYYTDANDEINVTSGGTVRISFPYGIWRQK